jgi:S-(hydroxymethyl)glutathione dehydrogenase/alcohol dehydrogenase
LTGVGAVLNRAKVRPGETSAVFGVGGVGLNVIQGLKIAGATKIVAVDNQPGKEALARQFGATDFVLAGEGIDSAKAVRQAVPMSNEHAWGALFPMGGVTWAFDCVGHPAVLKSALDCLDWGGNAVAIGIPPRGTEVSVDINSLAYVDRGLLGCRYGSARPHHDVKLMVDLYQSGQLKLDELVSLTTPLEQFRDVVDAMHSGTVARGVLTF